VKAHETVREDRYRADLLFEGTQMKRMKAHETVREDRYRADLLFEGTQMKRRGRGNLKLI